MSFCGCVCRKTLGCGPSVSHLLPGVQGAWLSPGHPRGVRGAARAAGPAADGLEGSWFTCRAPGRARGLPGAGAAAQDELVPLLSGLCVRGGRPLPPQVGQTRTF